jgi:hypothetical protein
VFQLTLGPSPPQQALSGKQTPAPKRRRRVHRSSVPLFRSSLHRTRPPARRRRRRAMESRKPPPSALVDNHVVRVPSPLTLPRPPTRYPCGVGLAHSHHRRLPGPRGRRPRPRRDDQPDHQARRRPATGLRHHTGYQCWEATAFEAQQILGRELAEEGERSCLISYITQWKKKCLPHVCQLCLLERYIGVHGSL